MFLRNIKLFLFVIVYGITIIPNVYAGKVYYDNFDTFENMLRSADLIILGSVVSTRNAEEPYKNFMQIARYSEFSIEKIISNKIDFNQQKIEIKTIDAMIFNGENILAHIPQKAQKGERYIALIKKRDNGYYLIYDNSSLIPILAEKIQNSDEIVDSYMQKIRLFISSDEKVFHGYKQPIYPEQNQKINAAAKSTVIVDWTYALRSISGKFFRTYSTPTTSQCTYTLHINPSGSQDGNGNYIGFAALKSVVDSACSDWNIISGANISFTIDENDSTSSHVPNNGISTITFDTSGVLWGENSGGDIYLNANKKWNLPGQSAGDANLRKTIAHEMGHFVNVDDL
ncbi:MAG: hypothetical protein Q8O92_07530 [Candidatus Latescibacter sp.]|nr:hypothetical protein [Candidatus Latescibacter sp.]